ncbi:MAG: hypothetical protein GF411_14710 [Candidatus Lokiarchaeota archaeon]|nr:hypothetical protein [Candidatus Lokiarchaeota archaeon]
MDGDETIDVMAMKGQEETNNDLCRAATSSYEELIRMSTLSTFVFEEQPTKKRSKKIRYPKAHERPRYTAIRAHEARRRMGLPEPKPDLMIKVVRFLKDVHILEAVISALLEALNLRENVVPP